MSEPLEPRFCQHSSPRIWVRRAKRNEPLKCILLGPWRGMYCHFDNVRKRSYPCHGPACKDHGELIWYAFAPALTCPTIRDPQCNHIVAELTDFSAAKLTGMDLRGRIVTLYKRQQDNLIVTDVKIENSFAKPDTIPQPFDVLPTLRKLFHCTDLPLDTVKPPFPLGHKYTAVQIVDYPPDPHDQNGQRQAAEILKSVEKGIGRVT